MHFNIGFNTQPPEGGWLANRFPHAVQHVSTHSRLKAAGGKFRDNVEQDGVSTHSRLKAAGGRSLGQGQQRAVSTHSRLMAWYADEVDVSTHSRLKAAGRLPPIGFLLRFGFNTQPPEGGWPDRGHPPRPVFGFNTQPPEGGWNYARPRRFQYRRVSTHSRLKAAGVCIDSIKAEMDVSTHSRLKAAGRGRAGNRAADDVSTHSRLKAAGFFGQFLRTSHVVSTHSRLKAAGAVVQARSCG